jgi:hypothetical protein
MHAVIELMIAYYWITIPVVWAIGLVIMLFPFWLSRPRSAYMRCHFCKALMTASEWSNHYCDEKAKAIDKINRKEE